MGLQYAHLAFFLSVLDAVWRVGLAAGPWALRRPLCFLLTPTVLYRFMCIWRCLCHLLAYLFIIWRNILPLSSGRLHSAYQGEQTGKINRSIPATCAHWRQAFALLTTETRTCRYAYWVCGRSRGTNVAVGARCGISNIVGITVRIHLLGLAVQRGRNGVAHHVAALDRLSAKRAHCCAPRRSARIGVATWTRVSGMASRLLSRTSCLLTPGMRQRAATWAAAHCAPSASWRRRR